MYPLISVIVPAYNAESTIARAIRSILNQTYPNIEIVVINDGSTDDTENVLLDNFAGRITYVSQSNKGLSAARNIGLRHATGEYIAFLDSDDEWVATKAERQKKVLEGTSIELVGTHRIRVKSDGDSMAEEPSAKADGSLQRVSFEQLIYGNRICGASVMAKRELFEQFQGYDEELPASEDHDLWLRMTAKGVPIANLKEPLYVFYDHRDSLRWDIDKVISGNLRILEKWNPEKSSLSSQLLSTREYNKIYQWWILKLVYRCYIQSEFDKGNKLLRCKQNITNGSILYGLLLVVAEKLPRLFMTMGNLKGYPRPTG